MAQRAAIGISISSGSAAPAVGSAAGRVVSSPRSRLKGGCRAALPATRQAATSAACQEDLWQRYDPLQASSAPTCGRRALTVFLVAAGGALQAAPPARSAVAAAAPPACDSNLNGAAAAAFTRAVYATVVALNVMNELQFQMEAFKLRDREYRYYYEANKAELSAVPDLSDNTGGLSNRTYFNFIYYILWKVVAKHVTTAPAQAAFCSAAGAELLRQLWPDGFPAPQASKPREEQLAEALLHVLATLKGYGFCCSYQVVWDEHPGGWPVDWMLSQPSVVGTPPVPQPAPQQQQSSNTQDGRAEGQGQAELIFQVKLFKPADIRGSVALRSEEDGFWSRTIYSMLASIFKDLGFSSAEADEYFYQDEWQGPTGLRERLLLFFGDPLEQVGIDFTPSTLVQNWRLRLGTG